ncbi:MAG: TIM barrel protein [Candidatus Methanoperedens sp.]|nr:TIM barrel protein [Candidatus Methanoperedens sp.]
MVLLFGTAGTPISSTGSDSLSGIKRVYELGLGCMELEFVHGVKMKEETARKVENLAKDLDIKLSVHAPYYINLNGEDETRIKSRERIFNSARIGEICGARSVVIHAGFIQKDTREAAYDNIKRELILIREQMDNEGLNITLRIETMGRISQFGTLDEVLAITEVDGVLPCIDFSHLHAIFGKNNSPEEFTQILGTIENKLGREGLNNMHAHISGIEYSAKGEKNHLELEKSDFNFRELTAAFSDFTIQGTIICESPNLEVDALKLKKEFEKNRLNDL